MLPSTYTLHTYILHLYITPIKRFAIVVCVKLRYALKGFSLWITTSHIYFMRVIIMHASWASKGTRRSIEDVWRRSPGYLQITARTQTYMNREEQTIRVKGRYENINYFRIADSSRYWQRWIMLTRKEREKEREREMKRGIGKRNCFWHYSGYQQRNHEIDLPT